MPKETYTVTTTDEDFIDINAWASAPQMLYALHDVAQLLRARSKGCDDEKSCEEIDDIRERYYEILDNYHVNLEWMR